MNVSTTDLAWSNLREFPPHKYRRSDIAFNGRTFVKTEHIQTAKGLSSMLVSFLTNSHQEHPREYYIPHIEHLLQIDPSSFIDCREWAEQDYELVGLPGDPPKPESLIAIRDESSNNKKYTHIWNYTTWSDGDDVFPRLLQIPTRCLEIGYSISYYWHICITRPPRSNAEGFSAFLNAVGMGYLRHPLLPAVHQSAGGAVLL